MTNIRNVVIGAVASAIVVGIVVSCGGGGGYGGGSTPAAAAATVVRSAALNGAQAGLPAVTATGRGAVVVDPTTLEITGGITFLGLTGAPTGGAHIHNQAVAGDPIIIGLTISGDNATAVVPAGSALTAAQYQALLNGQLYFQVHTTANPGGEIRGQITGTTGVTAGLATLSQANEVNKPVPSSGTGKGTLVVDSTTREIIVAYATYSGLTETPNLAHIHTGPLGTDGAIRINLTPVSGIAFGPTPATPPVTISVQDMSDFAIGYLYFQVHTPNNNPAGEIRGQIAVQ